MCHLSANQRAALSALWSSVEVLFDWLIGGQKHQCGVLLQECFCECFHSDAAVRQRDTRTDREKQKLKTLVCFHVCRVERWSVFEHQETVSLLRLSVITETPTAPTCYWTLRPQQGVHVKANKKTLRCLQWNTQTLRLKLSLKHTSFPFLKSSKWSVEYFSFKFTKI